MFIVIAFMLFGGILGFIFRKKKPTYASKAIMVLICLLLLLLGIEVGMNPEIISGITSIGLEALVITASSVIGSAFMAFLLWKHINHKKK